MAGALSASCGISGLRLRTANHARPAVAAPPPSTPAPLRSVIHDGHVTVGGNSFLGAGVAGSLESRHAALHVCRAAGSSSSWEENRIDLYDVLGVDTKATAKELKTAYRQMALRYHPDVNQDDPSALRKFLLIKRAYNTLSDPDARSAYDMTRIVEAPSVWSVVGGAADVFGRGLANPLGTVGDVLKPLEGINPLDPKSLEELGRQVERQVSESIKGVEREMDGVQRAVQSEVERVQREVERVGQEVTGARKGVLKSVTSQVGSLLEELESVGVELADAVNEASSEVVDELLRQRISGEAGSASSSSWKAKEISGGGGAPEGGGKGGAVRARPLTTVELEEMVEEMKRDLGIK